MSEEINGKKLEKCACPLCGETVYKIIGDGFEIVVCVCTISTGDWVLYRMTGDLPKKDDDQ